MKKLILAAAIALIVPVQSFAQPAPTPTPVGPTSGTWGFDHIGSAAASAVVHDINARCHVADGSDTNHYYLPVTSWTPPKTYSTYKPATFTALIGQMPSGSGSPIPPINDFAEYSIYIWGSHASFQTDPMNRYLAKYEFLKPQSPSAITFVPHSNRVASNDPTFTLFQEDSTVTYKATFRLNLASSTTYRTSSGAITNVPFVMTPGTTYIVGLGARNFDGPSHAKPCIVRARSLADARYTSPMPPASFTLPMTTEQCADGELNPGCSIRFDHGDLYSVSPIQGQGQGYGCDPSLSYVNWSSPLSTVPPLWNEESEEPDDPRLCGYNGTVPCCKRSVPGFMAYGLTVVPSKKCAVLSRLEPFRFIERECLLTEYIRCTGDGICGR